VNAAQALARWITGVATGESALGEARRKLEAHASKPPKSADAAEHRAWIAAKRDLEDNVAAEEAALRIAQAKQAEAQRAADDEAIDAQAKVAERDARAAARLVPDIAADAERLAAKLARLEELKASVDAYNKIRGARPFVQDGEARVREVPEKNFPTVYENMTVWVDPNTGRRPGQYREVNGKLVPADHNGDYVKTTEKVVSRNAYSVPAHIPGGRFASAMKLIGLNGEKF
jgi:hypothetical protein